MLTASGPDRDADLGWHVLLGREFLHWSVPGGSEHWTTLPADSGWRSGQWLSEVALAVAQDLWGNSGPQVFRVVSTAAALVVLGLSVGIHRPPAGVLHWWPLLPFASGCWVLMGFAQERPQQMGLILLPGAGWLAGRLLQPGWPARGGPRERLMTILGPPTVLALWVNCHQTGLLASVIVACAALSRWESGIGWRVLLAALCLGAPTASPTRVGVWSASIRVSEAAVDLAEWRPVALWSVPALGLAALIVGFVGCWVLLDQRPQRRLGLALLMLAVAGATAGRNLAAITLLLAPILAMLVPSYQRAHSSTESRRGLAGRCGSGDGTAAPNGRSRCGPQPSQAPPSPSRPSLLLAVALLTTGCTVAASRPVATNPVQGLARTLTCANPRLVGSVIATHYNDAGAVLFAARTSGCPGADATRVPLDGRADRYGRDQIRLWNATVAARPGWQIAFGASGAAAAILPTDAPLAGALQRIGWRIVDHGGNYLALRAPEDV